MQNIVIVDKETLNKINVSDDKIILKDASIIHTKLHRDDVAEFIQNGTTLIVKLKNGDILTIENFFTQYDDGLVSDLVFEDDECAFLWFDWNNGAIGFKEISGLDVLLPQASSSLLGGWLPWVAGGAAVIGGIAAASGGGSDGKTVDNIAPTVEVQLQGAGSDGVYNKAEIGEDGTVSALVKPLEGTEVGDILKVTDKNGTVLLERPLTQEDLDNGVTVQVPVAEGDTDVVVNATITDPAGNTGTASDPKPVDNVAPQFVNQLPPQVSFDSNTVEVDIDKSFKDENNGTLTYTVEGLPSGLIYDSNIGKVVGTIHSSASKGGPNNDGKYPITVTVTDIAGNKTVEIFEWEVNNPKPVATNDNQTVNEDQIATGN